MGLLFPKETLPGEELFTILSDSGEPLGDAPRRIAHERGLLHRVAFCWCASPGKEEPMLYFQQRAWTKKDFPGYYDIAVGGHVAAGESCRAALLREMGEEIGLSPPESALLFLGNVRESVDFGEFHDRELGAVTLCWQREFRFCPGEEVERVIAVPLSEFCRKVFQGREITARTLDGEEIFIPRDQWCRHYGQFESLVLPALERLHRKARGFAGPPTAIWGGF